MIRVPSAEPEWPCPSLESEKSTVRKEGRRREHGRARALQPDGEILYLRRVLYVKSSMCERRRTDGSLARYVSHQRRDKSQISSKEYYSLSRYTSERDLSCLPSPLRGEKKHRKIQGYKPTGIGRGALPWTLGPGQWVGSGQASCLLVVSCRLSSHLRFWLLAFGTLMGAVCRVRPCYSACFCVLVE
eukprot:scaffold162244_cov32-Tisochrysis_lutea.AAC.1